KNRRGASAHEGFRLRFDDLPDEAALFVAEALDLSRFSGRHPPSFLRPHEVLSLCGYGTETLRARDWLRAVAPHATLWRAWVSDHRRLGRVETLDRSPVDDRLLIARVQAGDATAARELYDAHVERVYRLVYRIAGDPDQAKDYTQDAFIRVFERLGHFRGDSSLGTWICAVALSVALNGLRKVRRLRTREV